MSVTRLCAMALSVICLQCGGQAPVAPAATTPTTASPTPAPAPAPAPVVPEQPPPVAMPSGGPETFVGAGDIAACDQNSEDTARLLDAIGGTVFTLGDNAYPKGAEPEFRTCYEPTWGRHKSRTRPSPGNHEYESPGAGPYFDYFGASAGPAGLGYYSFNLGAWHVVSLNSNLNIAAQTDWLQRDLEANRNRCTLAFWHHPLYSSGVEGITLAVRDWWRVLYRNNAELVLSSHDHAYERFAPQDHDGQFDPVRGLRQFIAGTGGAALHASRETMAYSETRISAFGVLKLTLASDSYDWEFVPVSGPGDRGSGRCH